ncbi:TetR/AcrR family transcriptional regulator [Nonomuraea salmonea]|uniref:TetR/AcrR family transcriptional regulator n=1 Tax=Nonomuraea salmonea TaxID=46181 RepID=UPI002FE75C41
MPSDTKARIQAVARELFVEQGVQNTSLRQISERLGITKPALYYHFSSRDDLVRSIVAPMIEDMERFVRDRAPGLQPRELLDAYFAMVWRHRDVIVMMVRELATLGQLDLGTRMFEWRRELIVMLMGGRTSRRPSTSGRRWRWAGCRTARSNTRTCPWRRSSRRPSKRRPPCSVSDQALTDQACSVPDQTVPDQTCSVPDRTVSDRTVSDNQTARYRSTPSG